MSKRQSSGKKSLTDLPPNILLEILVRLPLKTLFASKCVCTTFLNLTSPNPHFIRLHSSNAAQTLAFQFGGDFNPSTLLRLLEPELDIAPGSLQYTELKPIFQLPKILKSNISHYRSNSREVNKFVLVNSCNGLLYFVRRNAPDERSLVCNPVTNEYIMIPDIDEESGLHSRTKSMWLGFSPRSNQHKVLRIFGSIGGEPMEVGAQVLVVGSSSWRNIGDTLLGSDHSWDTCSTFVNGFVYWFDHSRKDIVFFDFEREMFGDIALPHEFGEEQLRNIHCMTIGVLGGCLSLSYNDVVAHHVDIWLMKKPGNQESWSKEFIVVTFPANRPVYGLFKPLQILRNGEIVMLWINNALVSYDPINKSLKYVGSNLLRLNPKAVAFTPSFNSLKDTLLVDKVIMKYVRPRGDEVEL